MSRYFFEIAYDGTNYSGWQIQPNAPSIQSVLETCFSKIFQENIKIVGCGRTDTGVHASQYYFHVDLPEKWTEDRNFGLNNMLPKDIAVKRTISVHPDAHARFDAQFRAYEYHIHWTKDPFNSNFSSYIRQAGKFELDRLNEMAAIFEDFDSYEPFCKAHSDVKTKICKVTRSYWVREKESLVYHIGSDRFLRGMVRLIVGAQLNVLEGKLSKGDIRNAFENQTKLAMNLSAPAHGLRLSEVDYAFIEG